MATTFKSKSPQTRIFLVEDHAMVREGLADDQQFTARWEGTLTVPTDGVPGVENFTFFTRSDDGIRLVLGDTNSHTLIDH